MRRVKNFGSILGLFLAMTLTSKADVQIGAFEAPPNCFPFGNCGYAGEYQQAYDGTAFAGIARIVSIGFASVLQTTPGPETLGLHLGLSTMPGPLNLSTDYAANKGADFVEVFSGLFTFTPSLTSTFDLVFPTTPFLFNPANGNLLLDVVIDSATGPGVTFFGATTDALTMSVFNSGGTGAPVLSDPNVSTGLVTNIGIAAAVPEPTALILLASVIGILMVTRRTRQASKTA